MAYGEVKSLNLRVFVILILLTASCGYAADSRYEPREGDLVFQSSRRGELVDTIEGATHSKYSHVGLVILKKAGWYVREAVGFVKDTPLKEWIERGRYSHAFDAFRLKEAFQKDVRAFVSASADFLGRPYDFRYRMDDQAIYCSELVYKSMLNATGVHLGKLQRLGDLDWRPYRAIIEKYEGGEAPLDREMITPQGLSEAAALEKVYDGFPH
jgi:hypothetical protein